MFTVAIPQMEVLNIMHLSSPASAILSALIFNAIIIPMLVPVALKGVKYTPVRSEILLLKNLTIYGLGGIIFPFIMIKLIDILVSPMLMAVGIN